MQIVSSAPYLTRDERKLLHQKNDWLACWEILVHWAWIVGAFALVYFFPNIFTILVSLFILGGKQLACAILMHDAGHYAVFKNKKVNDRVGQWLGGYPVFQDVLKYRDYHYRHHVENGTEEDPDLLLTRGYPTSRKSMFRKIFRDLTGQTGIKAFVGLVMMHLGYLKYNLGGRVERVSQKERTWKGFAEVFFQNLSGPILANFILFSLLYWLASPWLYLLWAGAYLTTFQFSLRIRSMAEHSMSVDQLDPYQNTRTTYANSLEKLLFAPYHVNYHAEHHMLMSVPSYNLKKMHQLIKARGYYKKGMLEKNYWNVIKQAIK
ncbi:MAG: fatty acid desaturase family protein [Bacteroidota bacterium]